MSSPSEKKIVLVTGGNNGIGFEIVRALLQSDKEYHIVMGSRSVEKGESAMAKLKEEFPDLQNTLEVVQLDLTDDQSVEGVFKRIQDSHAHLDVLINNAGATFDPDCQRGLISIRESFTKSYDVNVAGTNVLTHTLTPLLLLSSDPRLIFITGLSNLSQAAEKYFPTAPQPAGYPKPIQSDLSGGFETIGYRCSKVALNMLMLDWNFKLQADGVKVWAIGPGMLETDLGGLRDMAKKMPGIGHASLGGEFTRTVVEGARDADVGKIVCRGGIIAF
ncbi:hypothetical protein FB45DRAFT_828930 [Roridomyces roridus]|uniref:Uncharacterized protein n=1 Tax=Roridomyces roridus TaxID=1738132 RepID=A0AAD7FTL5_9AGAR|nr:hypothetical protein FB45DRAFT_828930 [Roridomyces roridus]